jgi:virginiamycin B lyase
VTDFPLEEGDAYGLCVGPDDALWATDNPGNRLRRIGFDGRWSSVINLPSGTGPSRIITGPDGALWFIEMSQGKIGRFSPKTGEITDYPLATENGSPYALAVGPDKNIWFTDSVSHKVGRLIPDPVQ